MLISLGVVNAINLDGGGSATMVSNGSLINYPSDSVLVYFTVSLARVHVRCRLYVTAITYFMPKLPVICIEYIHKM